MTQEERKRNRKIGKRISQIVALMQAAGVKPDSVTLSALVVVVMIVAQACGQSLEKVMEALAATQGGRVEVVTIEEEPEEEEPQPPKETVN